jgi:glycine/D-amino acid oxidase-like deaminating enzyme
MPGYGRRYWAERTSASHRHTYPKFRGAHTADAVVIGGGLTGCAAAYVLAAAGLDVIVLEADRLAGGGTSGGLGAILPAPDAAYRDVEVAAGRRAARIAWKEAHRGALEFASALRRLRVKCDLEPASLVVNAPAASDVPALRREQAARRGAGLDTPWLIPKAARAELGTDSSGAMRLTGVSLYDPVRAALALARAAESKRARIFERSSVRRTRFTRKDATVQLASGSVRTRAVIVATGEPGSLFGQLRRHVRRLDGYAVVTEPLAAEMRRETGRRDSVLADAGASPHWVRWLPEHRALFAGAMSRPVGWQKRDKMIVQRTGQLMYEFSVRYPVISGLPAHWSWDVPVVSTPHGLPWIGPHRNYPFHFFAMAFGWHGDGLSWFAARAALRFVQGSSRREDDVFAFVRYL